MANGSAVHRFGGVQKKNQDMRVPQKRVRYHDEDLEFPDDEHEDIDFPDDDNEPVMWGRKSKGWSTKKKGWGRSKARGLPVREKSRPINRSRGKNPFRNAKDKKGWGVPWR